MLRRILLQLVQACPSSVKQWVYGQPWIARRAAALVRSIVPAHRPLIVTITEGPNRGMKLAMDRSTPRYYWLRGHDEQAVISQIERLVKPGMTVADVGAHIGMETMIFSRLVGPHGRVLSFEPDPSS